MKVFYFVSMIVCALLFITCIFLVIFGIATSQGTGSIILNTISAGIFAFSGAVFYLRYDGE